MDEDQQTQPETLDSDQAVAAKLESLLDATDPSKPAEAKPAPAAAEAPAAASAAAEPEVQAEAEPEPLTPPNSMPADMREQFDKLPREFQEFLVQRERDTSNGGAKVAAKASEAEKAATAAQTQLAAELQRVTQLASQFKHPDIVAFEREFQDVLTGKTSLQSLVETDPLGRYLRYDVMLKNAQAAQQNMQAAHQQAQTVRASELQKFRETENTELKRMLGLKDDKAFAEVDTKLSNYLINEAGVSPDVIKGASAKVLALAYDGIRYREAAAKLKAAKQQAAPVNVQRPGTTEGKSSDSEAVKADRNRLARTGKHEDAARLIERMM